MRNNYFAPSYKGNPYCIILPPPNVTGTLHMGHGFQDSIMDALIRYHRMCGYNTLWQLGIDHAGIATQIIVENIIRQEGGTRHELGRENFIKRIWEWKKYSGNTIAKQEQRLGISGDWNNEKFTLDPELVTTVKYVFIKLYEDGLIYRGKRLVNWDPALNTAISDLEVINEEKEGELWYIKYPIVDSNENVIVATTRPETIFGDVAVAVHPADQRYQHLIGKQVKLPLTDRVIPVIADTYVERDFGSGCVKITPAHDFNDYYIGQKHNLPMINIMTPDAHLNENTPKKYRGLERFISRKQIIADLAVNNLLVKTEKHLLKIPKGDRSGVIIEPYLTNQWFVKTKELATPAIQAVLKGEIKFIPNNWSKTYLQWLSNIEDWCISRQLWWGHRIPAWYDEKNHIYVGNDEGEIREKFQLKDQLLKQDTDVLDTWFSAALWPFSTLGWPANTKEFKTFYPTSVLVTGFDIIFFWVARMIMMGLKLTGRIPFKEIYITGLIRDRRGQKMSKSKGNVLDPIDLVDGITLEKLVSKRTEHLMQKHLTKKIEQQTCQDFPHGIKAFGVDALRFTFCSLATTSRDINFDITRLEGYRNFCTKLWNAARFVIIQLEKFDFTKSSKIEYSIADRWIQTELQNSLQIVIDEFRNYRFDLVTQAIYEFTWHEFCDWYLELTKSILNSNSTSIALKQGTRVTLVTIFEKLLRIIHPFMPFITEEIWQEIAPKMQIIGQTIMWQKYPEVDITAIDNSASAEIKWLKKIILAIRNFRGEMSISPTEKIQLLLDKGSELDSKRISNYQDYLKSLGKLLSIEWIKNKTKFEAPILVGTLELYLIKSNTECDPTIGIAMINKEIRKLEYNILQLEDKLKNINYLTKAPKTIVSKDQEKLVEYRNLLRKLQINLENYKLKKI
jgi:valyl-tRNA synthetase